MEVGGTEGVAQAVALVSQGLQPLGLVLGRTAGQQEPLVAFQTAHLERVPHRHVELDVWSTTDDRTPTTPKKTVKKQNKMADVFVPATLEPFFFSFSSSSSFFFYKYVRK